MRMSPSNLSISSSGRGEGGQNAQGADTKLHGYNAALDQTKLQQDLAKNSANGLNASEQQLNGTSTR